MKRIFLEKGLVFFIVFIVFLISAYLYKQGKISFLPKKGDSSIIQNTTAELPFAEKEYRLSYNDKAKYAMIEAASFTDNENWQGDGELDYANFYLGKSSLSLNSQNNKTSKVSLNLANGFNFNEVLEMRFLVNVRSDVANIESFSLTLFDKSGGIYRYPVGNMSGGWNMLILPQDKFVSSKGSISLTEPGSGQINRLEIELVSRPKTMASVNLEYLWAEKSDITQDDWSTNNPKYLILRSNGSVTSLLYMGIFEGIANLKAIGSAKNYTMTMKFVPLSDGSFGLFLRGDYKAGIGYLFILDGVKKDTWRISKVGIFDQKKQTINLAEGNINNFEVIKNKPYWLRGELKGERLAFYLSLNGKDYARIGEATDKSFVSGGIGFYSGGSILLIDDIQFFQ